MTHNILFDYLCCPVCKSSLKKQRSTLHCTRCDGIYSIKQGIPILVNLQKLPIHLQKQIDYFEKEDNARSPYKPEPWQQRYVDSFIHMGEPKEHGVIIDNATGIGYMAIELAKRGFRVIATDLTLVELVQLSGVIRKQKLESNILLVCCTSEALPIKAKSADGLVANAILEHLPKEKEAISEIRRVLKPQSPVMVAMPLSYRYIVPLLWPLNYIHDKRIGHLRRYTRESIVKKFRGFREYTTYYTGYLPKIVCSILFLITRWSVLLSISEQTDLMFGRFPYGASNIVSILKKR